MDIVNPQVEAYMRGLLARHDEPMLLEMETEAQVNGLPIIGRLVGVTVEVLARSIGAKRVFEFGSGYGYSAYWFSLMLVSVPSYTVPESISEPADGAFSEAAPCLRRQWPP